MGNDNLSIISFNSSRRGLMTMSPEHRPSYLQRLLESTEPDICFLPGDDKYAKLNVIRGYGQYTIQNNDDTVLLYDNNRVNMQEPKVSLNSFGQIPGLDLYKMVVPQVEVSTLMPYKQIVKEFSLVSWTYDFFQSAKVRVETLVESIITFSQMLALCTEKPVLIGGEMNIDFNILMKIVKKLSYDSQEKFLSNVQPMMNDVHGFLPSMTKASFRDMRHLFMMKVFRCKSNSTNGIVETWDDRKSTEVVADCFIASKQLQLADASLLDVEKVIGRKVCMPLVTYKPTQTSMEIPVRPPRKLYRAKRISQYKEMLQDYRIDEKHLMTEFDHILRYAEEHNLNEYEFSTCHKLIDCGERDECKLFNFILKMNNSKMLTTDMFLSWRNIPSVDNIMISLGEHRSASGVIEMKCFTSRRALYDVMRQLLSDSDVCFVIWSPVSMNDYQKLISRCMKL